MLNIDGINIEDLPFKGLREISELMSFQDNPILIHLQDEDDNDVICYWVDFDVNGNRWLYSKISRKELFFFLLAGQSLKELLLNLSSDFIFLLDFDLEDNIISNKMISSKKIPTEYLPKEESFFLIKLSEFYSNYLQEYDYLTNLRAKSYSFKISPIDDSHRTTVSARHAAIALNGFTNSIEGYIKVTAYNLLKNDFGDVNKINRRINKLTSRLSPRIAETSFNSFEFWLAIDVVSFSGDDKYDSELRNTIVEGYKKDVIDVDYNDEADAVIITEKYNEDEIKKIYEPFIKIIDNKDFIVSISNNASNRKKATKTNEKFKNIILPKPTLEQLEEEINKKNIIFQFVVNLKEGDDLGKLTKKELLDNLLYGEQLAQTPYKFPSPISSNGIDIELKEPLDCIMTISQNGNIQMYNSVLDLFFESNDINEVFINIKSQFIKLYSEYMKNIESKDSRILALKKYIV